MEIHPFVQIAGVVLGPAGAAWLGVKMSLNGLKQRVASMEGKLDSLADSHGIIRERLARVETKIDG